MLDSILAALMPDANSPRWYQWLWILGGFSLLLLILVWFIAG